MAELQPGCPHPAQTQALGCHQLCPLATWPGVGLRRGDGRGVA